MKLCYLTTEHGDISCASIVSKYGQYEPDLTVYAFTTIEDACHIGFHCVVGSNVFIGRGTQIDDGTRIQHGAFICRGARIGKNVFIGPLAILTDDKHPVVGTIQTHEHYSYDAKPPILKDGCSIGAGAIIMPGITVGENAMVGAGAIITHDVEPGTTVIGVPARKLISDMTPGERLVIYYPEREGFGIP